MSCLSNLRSHQHVLGLFGCKSDTWQEVMHSRSQYLWIGVCSHSVCVCSGKRPDDSMGRSVILPGTRIIDIGTGSPVLEKMNLYEYNHPRSTAPVLSVRCIVVYVRRTDSYKHQSVSVPQKINLKSKLSEKAILWTSNRIPNMHVGSLGSEA